MMNREILITIIACAIVFSGISFLAYNTVNSEQVPLPIYNTVIETPPTMQEDVSETPAITPDTPLPTVEEDSVESLVNNPKSMIKRLDANTSIHRTLTGLIIPVDNKHVWGNIEGKVGNAAPGHPVIIQFFKSLDDVPVHVAQVDLNDDGTFAYQFRLFSIDDGVTTHIFEGEYYVEIFKTIITPTN